MLQYSAFDERNSDLISRSSFSSRDSSQESDHHHSGGCDQQNDGHKGHSSRSRSLSRRSRSILEKAKIWETVDETEENRQDSHYR